MDTKSLRSWCEVDLDILKNNIKILKKHIGNGIKMAAVIKSNAYGHGAVEIAKCAEESGVYYFAVACMEEAKQLRRAGIKTPILILSYVSEHQAEELINYDVTASVFNREIPEKLNEYAKKHNKIIKVHIKIDTGMTRLGFNSDNISETINDIAYINSLSNIEIEGIFTHYADADNEEGNFTEIQYEKYKKIIDKLDEININIPIKHTCNSAAGITNKEFYNSMIRFGIILYGYYPEAYLKNILPGLQPFLSIKSNILQIKDVPENVTIGYGRTYKTSKKTRVGVVPIGYADGYPRALSNKFYVLISGKKAPIIGRICMDQLMVDLTDIPEANEGDIVIILGRDNNNIITADDIAKTVNTICYEILCDVGMRLPVLYIKNNRIIKKLNYLE